MLKKATVLLIVFTLVVSFSMTAFASDSECEDLDRANVTRDGNSITICTPADPPANLNAVSTENEDPDGNEGLNENKNPDAHGPHNPIYVAGD